MHECLLFAAVPAAQHDHILKVLAGISAMQPLPVKEHHLIFKPSRPTASLPTTIEARTASQQPGAKPLLNRPKPISASTDLFYLQLVGDLTKTKAAALAETERRDSVVDNENDGNGYSQSQSTFPDDQEDETAVDEESQDVAMIDSISPKPRSYPYHSHHWTLHFKSLPDVLAGRTGNSRLISSIPLKHGNPRDFMEALGYSYMTSYITSGHRFVHGYVEIRLYKTYSLPNPLPSGKVDAGKMDNAVPLVPDESELKKIPLADPAGGSMLEAIVLVRDGANADRMKEAMRELEGLQSTLAGIVKLEPVDRLSLDTRIKSTPIGKAAKPLS